MQHDEEQFQLPAERQHGSLPMQRCKGRVHGPRAERFRLRRWCVCRGRQECGERETGPPRSQIETLTLTLTRSRSSSLAWRNRRAGSLPPQGWELGEKADCMNTPPPIVSLFFPHAHAQARMHAYGCR